MSTNITFTELDFFRNKEALKEYLKAQDRFKDYDFEGSNLNAILDVLAYNTHMNNYYVHAAFSETFLDTAQLRENINSHAKELNYLPRSRRSSTATVNLNLVVPATETPPFVKIPRHTEFIGKCDGQTFTFYNDEAATVFPTNGVYGISGLKLFEGKIKTEYYYVDNAQPQRYVINSDYVDTDSIRVFVEKNTVNAQDEEEFLFTNDIFGVVADSNVFYLQPHSQNKYELYFGKNTFGYEPEQGNRIRIEYRTTQGEGANGVRLFTSTTTIGGYIASITLLSSSEGGAERESISDIRYFAPKSIQVQDRAVTESDYEILLKTNFSEIQAVSVYGGEEANPPQFGQVIVAVDIENMDGVTNSAAERYKEFLSTRTPLSIEPSIISAEFMYVEVVSEVTFNTAITSLSSADIHDSAVASILLYNNEKINDFNETLRFSQLSRYIDDASRYIVSNSTQCRAILEYVPILNSSENVTLNFENKLDYDHELAYGDIHHPAIQSSNFTVDNQSCFLADDGSGNLQLVSLQNGTYSIVSTRAGTVDYETGIVNITALSASAYDGTAIKFYATIRELNITSPKSRILKIREEDVTVTTLSARI